jgi:hypothetical protein
LPSFCTSDFSVSPVATSFHGAGNRIAHADGDKVVAVEIERKSVRRREPDLAELRGDGARIAHAGRDKGREPSVGGSDGSKIDDGS